MISKEDPTSSDVHVATIMGNQRRRLTKKRMKADLALRKLGIDKGDRPGHPFRGNQWTKGKGVKSPLLTRVSGASMEGKNTPAALKAMALEGGFTFNPKRNEIRRNGTSVAINKKYEEKHSVEDFEANGEKIILEYARRNAEALSQPRAHLGAWREGNEIYLDVSHVMNSQSGAADIGRAHDQIGIFELSTFTTLVRFRSPTTGQYKYLPQKEEGETPYTPSEIDLLGKADSRKGVMLIPAETIDASTAALIAARILELEPISGSVNKGDYMGHPFRGNQWTGGRGRGGVGAGTRLMEAMPKKPKAKSAAQKQKEIDALSDEEYDVYKGAPKWMGHDDIMTHISGKPVKDPDGDDIPLGPNGYPVTPRSMKDLPKDTGPQKGDGGRFSETGGDPVAAGMRRPTDAERKYGVVDADGIVYRIPPDYHDVWVSASPSGNSSGLIWSAVDSGLKAQPKHTARHRSQKDADKFVRVAELQKNLKEIDKRLAADIKAGDQRAIAVALMRHTGMRAGSSDGKSKKRNADGSIEEVDTFGITNLLNGHVTMLGNKGVRLQFKGKGGKDMDVTLTGPRELIDAMAALKQANKGKKGPIFSGTSYTKVTGYLKEVAGDYKNHDFRTLKATIEAKKLVDSLPKPKTAKELERMRKQVGKEIGLIIGDTFSTTLKSYINPIVFAAWEKGIKP